MTVKELQSKIYIETIREKYENRDFMFTTICEHEMQKQIADEEKLKDMFKDLDGSEKERRLKILENRKSNIITEYKDKDFALALLFICWKRYHGCDNLDIAESSIPATFLAVSTVASCIP